MSEKKAMMRLAFRVVGHDYVCRLVSEGGTFEGGILFGHIVAKACEDDAIRLGFIELMKSTLAKCLTETGIGMPDKWHTVPAGEHIQ